MEHGKDPILNHRQLESFTNMIDVAELSASGDAVGALARLASHMNTAPVTTMGTLVGFLGGILISCARAQDVSNEEMAKRLRASGAL